MTNREKITMIYKSRITILDFLKRQEYETNEYENFSIIEVNKMYDCKQLDMILKNANNESVYVKYHFSENRDRAIKASLDDYIDDLYVYDTEFKLGTDNSYGTVLKNKDTLIVITDNEIPETMYNKQLVDYYDQDKRFIILFNLGRLQYNILNHEYVPSHIILSESAKESMKLEYNITEDKQIPTISRFDPVAQAIGMRPGQVCRINRASKTTITADYYRLCVKYK